MEEPKQSTISSTTDGSEGSTTTNERTQQTPNVNETKASQHHHKLGRDGRRSIGTPGGVVGTHEYIYNSVSTHQPTDIGEDKKQAPAPSESSTATQSEAAPKNKSKGKDGPRHPGTGGGQGGTHDYPLAGLKQEQDGAKPPGTAGGGGGTHEYAVQGVSISTTTSETHSNTNQTITSTRNSSQTDDETQVSSHPLTLDPPLSGGTNGSDAGTH